MLDESDASRASEGIQEYYVYNSISSLHELIRAACVVNGTILSLRVDYDPCT